MIVNATLAVGMLALGHLNYANESYAAAVFCAFYCGWGAAFALALYRMEHR
jgi:hypothetical protein